MIQMDKAEIEIRVQRTNPWIPMGKGGQDELEN